MLRDDGYITIGTYIAVLNPEPIRYFWCNDIPTMETRGGCVVMKKPSSVQEVQINKNLIGMFIALVKHWFPIQTATQVLTITMLNDSDILIKISGFFPYPLFSYIKHK